MDLKPIIVNRLDALVQISGDLSLGELLYEVCRRKNMPTKPESTNTTWFLDISDNEFFKAIEKVIKNETKFRNED